MSGNWNVLVTSYSTLRSDFSQLSKEPYNVVVLDEGHLLKNPDTATARAAREIKARHRVVLSGTPVQNNVGELWAAIDWCMPGFLGTRQEFGRAYGKVIQESVTGGVMSTEAEQKLKSLHQLRPSP